MSRKSSPAKGDRVTQCTRCGHHEGWHRGIAVINPGPCFFLVHPGKSGSRCPCPRYRKTAPASPWKSLLKEARSTPPEA